MHRAKIFLVGSGPDKLITLAETGYVNEKILQEYLVDYPDLLPGDQIDPENPRRWLLVSAEMSVPGDDSQTGQWSLDHLFLDQDGIPTFVECKRASDTRIRREVVAQMLDYAANGTQYWTLDRLRKAAEGAAQVKGRILEEELQTLLQVHDAVPEALDLFWQKVEANLRTHRIRLIFVADQLPKELRRIIEFLNEEMRSIEVLGVEVTQYQRNPGEGWTALVPRVVGMTERVREAKGLASEADFLERCEPAARIVFKRVLESAQQKGHIVYWGQSGFSVRTQAGEGILATYSYGFPPNTFQFYLDPKWNLSEESSLALRNDLLATDLFKASGKYTISASILPHNAATLEGQIPALLDKVVSTLLPPQV